MKLDKLTFVIHFSGQETLNQLEAAKLVIEVLDKMGGIRLSNLYLSNAPNMEEFEGYNNTDLARTLDKAGELK